MYYVYYLQSTKFYNQVYKGFTKNLKVRVLKHNRGEVSHTSKYKPWKLVFYIAVGNKKTAKELERYFKSSSGKAFLNKHFLCSQ